MLALPSYFFSYRYLENLALTSRSMLARVRSGDPWKGLCLDVDCDELNDRRRLRGMRCLWLSTAGVVFNVNQRALLSDWPDQTFIKFATVSAQAPYRFGRQLHAFSSVTPLLGVAIMELRLPQEACHLYMGVENLGQTLKSWCRIDNIFHRATHVVFWHE